MNLNMVRYLIHNEMIRWWIRLYNVSGTNNQTTSNYITQALQSQTQETKVIPLY